MSVDVKYEATKPESIEFTLSITMTMGEWKKLKNQLADAYPAWELANTINQVIDKAENEFWQRVED